MSLFRLTSGHELGLLFVVVTLAAGAPLQVGAAAPVAPSESATVAEIVQCAEQRHAHNMESFTGYTVRINSTRQGYTLEGKLAEDFRITKTVEVSPRDRKETFEKGTKNGEPAEVGDFWMEKLGLSKKYNAENMNIFSQASHGRYDYVLRGKEQAEGRDAWKLAFKVKESGSQELQKGHVWIDQRTCGVIRAEGDFPTLWVTEQVRAELVLIEARPGLWLPSKQTVNLKVSMPMLKRKARMIDEFQTYRVRDSR